MSYLVLARKWRPQTFADLIGQEHVSRTLQNAIGSGRVAHAFLFTGARGVGKTSAARILAKALNCEAGPAAEPCNICSLCSEITDGNSVDVFEIDGASNTSVDDVRELRETVKYLPSRARRKIFIIDEVHMLSTSAFNALLKTLEEPPPHVTFIFATTEPHKVPITILSRCQRFDFRRIPLPLLVGRLRHIVDQEGVTISDAALAMIARKGDGSMRDSLSTLDQVLAFCGERVDDAEVVNLLGVVDRRLLLESSRAVLARDSRAALEIVRQVDAFGYGMRPFCQELVGHFRNLTIIRAVADPAELLDLAQPELEEIELQARDVPLADLQRHLAILMKAEGELAHATFPRLVLEMALLRMASLAPAVPVEELLERLKSLEGRLTGGGGAVPAPRTREPQRSPAADVLPSPARLAAPAERTTAPAPPAPAEVRPVAATKQAAAAGEGDPWAGFVASVRGSKPLLASLLEHARPLQVAAAGLTIGFPPNSPKLGMLRDPEKQAQLQELAQAYFGGDPVVKVVTLEGEASAAPISLSEKKSRDEARRRENLRQDAERHPVVAAALEIFGGEISAVAEEPSES